MAGFREGVIAGFDHVRDILEFQLPVPEDEGKAQEARKKNRRRAFAARTVYAVLFVFAALLIFRYVSEHWVYSSYETVASETRTDNVSSYRAAGGNILRSSADGVSLIGRDMQTLWNTTYDMDRPATDVCGETALVYDRGGSKCLVCGKEGVIGTFQTEYPILKAAVGAAGNVAAALEGTSGTRISYYTSQGELIAEIAPGEEEGGEVLSFDVSDAGRQIAVSYVHFSENAVGSRIVVYDFSDGSADDHVKYQSTYNGILIPQVVYLGNDLALVRENGFTSYSYDGTVIGEKTFEDEIVSVFDDGTNLGFVFDGGEESLYRMEVYRMSGKLLSECAVDIVYEEISVSGDAVIFSNSSEAAVYTTGGNLKYRGSLSEGALSQVIKLGGNRYFVVTDIRTELLKLK